MKITHKLTYEGKCGKHSEFDECTVIKNINLQYTISNPIKQLHVILYFCFLLASYIPHCLSPKQMKTIFILLTSNIHEGQ